MQRAEIPSYSYVIVPICEHYCAVHYTQDNCPLYPHVVTAKVPNMDHNSL